MILLSNVFEEKIILDHGHFSVAESSALESLLNTMAKAHPVINGGSPDPDFDLVQNLVGIAPDMFIVKNSTPDADDDDDDSDDSKIY